MKRLIGILLALVMLAALAACGGNTGGNSSTTPPANSTTTTPPADNTPSGGNDTTPSDNGGNTVGDAAGWPDNEFTQQVPKPQYSFSQEANGDSTTYRTYPNWTKEQAKSYVTELESSGFAIDGSVADYDDQYLAVVKNADKTYTVKVQWDSVDGGLLSISEPFSFN